MGARPGQFDAGFIPSLKTVGFKMMWKKPTGKEKEKNKRKKERARGHVMPFFKPQA